MWTTSDTSDTNSVSTRTLEADMIAYAQTSTYELVASEKELYVVLNKEPKEHNTSKQNTTQTQHNTTNVLDLEFGILGEVESSS